MRKGLEDHPAGDAECGSFFRNLQHSQVKPCIPKSKTCGIQHWNQILAFSFHMFSSLVPFQFIFSFVE